MSTEDFTFSTCYDDGEPTGHIVRMSKVTHISNLLKEMSLHNHGVTEVFIFEVSIEGLSTPLHCLALNQGDDVDKAKERTEAFRQSLLKQFQKRFGECWTPTQQQVEEEPPTVNPVEAFHNHLDVCAQCLNHPFNLCAMGQNLLRDQCIMDRP